MAGEGRQRTVGTIANYNTTTPLFADRGFTAHEHLDDFGLINMNLAIKREQSENAFSTLPSVSQMREANGRLYDPVVGRFLNPDNFVQQSGNLQNYNRYSYCLNNPLKYTDPSGEKWDKWYDYINPMNYFIEGMQFINDNTTGLRNWMVDNNVPDFMVGGSYTSAGDINFNFSVNGREIVNTGIDRRLKQMNNIDAYASYQLDNYLQQWREENLLKTRTVTAGRLSNGIILPEDYVIQAANSQGDINSTNIESPDWVNTTGTVLGASGTARGIKMAILDFAAKSDKSIKNLKYYKGVKTVGRYAGGASVLITGAEVLYESEFRASHALDVTMTGLSFIPGFGWAIGGGYFVTNLIVNRTTGIDIGEYLDSRLNGGVISDW